MNAEFKDFDAWFKKQYGRLPNESRRVAAIHILNDLNPLVKKAQADYDDEKELAASYRDSMYGYNAGKQP